jgi:hypothetical protein
METWYQTIDQSGISIPLAIVRSFGLSEGTRIAISWQKDGIRVAPAEVSAEDIQNRALRFLLKNVGDAVSIGRLQRTAAGHWLAPVRPAGRPARLTSPDSRPRPGGGSKRRKPVSGLLEGCRMPALSFRAGRSDNTPLPRVQRRIPTRPQAGILRWRSQPAISPQDPLRMTGASPRVDQHAALNCGACPAKPHLSKVGS